MARKTSRPKTGRRPAAAPRPEAARPFFPLPPAYIWSFATFIALAAIVAPYGQTLAGYNPNLSMASYLQLGTVLFLLAFLLHQLVKGRSVINLPLVPLLWPLLCLYLWMALSLFWALNLYEGVVKVLDWGAGIGIFLLALLLVRDSRALFPILCCLFVSATVLACLGLGQHLFDVSWVFQPAPPAATFGNRNMASQYMVMTLPLGLCLMLNTRTRSGIWFYAIGAGLVLGFLAHTRTRASWLALLLEAVVMGGAFVYLRSRQGHSFPWNRTKTLATIASLALVLGLAVTNSQTFSQGTQGASKDNPFVTRLYQGTSVLTKREQITKSFVKTRDIRFTMWANSTVILKDFLPLGVGIGNWAVFYPGYQTAFAPDTALLKALAHNHAHNDYVEFLVELGPIGGILILWLLITALRASSRVLTNANPDHQARTLAMAPIIALVGIAANAFFSFPLQQPVTIALTTLFLGLLALSSRRPADQAPADQTPTDQKKPRNYLRLPLTRHYGVPLALLISAGALWLGNLSWHWHRAETLRQQSYTALINGHYRPLGQAIRSAIRHHPMRTELHWMLGHYNARVKLHHAAIKEYQRTLKDYPYTTHLIPDLASSYERVGKTDKMKELLESWVRLQPHQWEAFKEYGLAALQLGNREEGTAALRRAKKLYDKDWAIIQRRLARYEKKHGKSRELSPGQGQFVYTNKQQIDALLVRLAAEAVPQSTTSTTVNSLQE